MSFDFFNEQLPEVFQPIVAPFLEKTEETSMAEVLEQTEGLPAFVVTEMQEQAPSVEVQSALIQEEFLNIEEVQFENWTILSLEERVGVLQNLEECVASITHRDSMSVQIVELSERVTGYCNGEALVLSQECVMNDSYDGYCSMLNTFFHECRHGYQFYNVNVARVESNEELVATWEENLLQENGNARIDIKSWGFQRYLEQPVEVDARDFAQQVMTDLEIGPDHSG